MFSNNNTFNENGTTNDRVEQFSKQLFGGLVQAAKLSNNLPSEEDYSYYETFPEFKLKMNSLGKRLLNLAQNFVQSENPKSDLSLTDTNDVDDLSDRFSGIVDIVDGMIDKVDKTIDPKYNQNQTNIFISSTVQPGNNKKAGNEINMFYGNNIVRPQHKFEDPFDNNNFPFLPKIRSKPNAMVELDEVFKKSIPKEISFGKIIRSKEQEGIIFPHPYEYEINNFKYTEQQTQQCKEILARGLEETPFTWVETVRQLEELVEKLIHCQEIAIDLEHHSYRTYQGFTCLMQISTRSEDFLIDTLLLRSHIHMLNQVFTNASIVKVLHGSDSDIKWLQRDFGVYIVNMFDTGQASRILEYPSASLAFLLKFYCAIDANKKYQLADWRIRKLPEEMIKYAREDTHYLLYIYDRLRNELISKGNKNLGTSGTSTNTSTITSTNTSTNTTQSNNHLLLEVLRRSRELSLLRYEKDILDDNSHINFAKKLNLQYSPTQLNVLKVLYHWREGLARDEDESVRYILPNQMMLTIIERQPTSVQELLTLCSPIPPSIKQHSHQLIQEILKARIEDPSKQPSFIPQLHSLLNNQSNVFYTQKQQQIQQQQAAAAATVPQATATTVKSIIQPPQPQQPQQQQPIKTERSLSPVPNIKNHNSNSPVLTTDQLYKTAKWLSSDVDNATGNGNFGQSATTHVAMVNNLQPAFQSLTSIGKKSTCVSSVNQSNHSSTSISTNSLFDISSSGDDENHPDRKRSKRIASMVASSFEQSTYAPVFKPTQQLKSIDQQQQQQSDNNNNNNNNGDGDNNQDSEITGGVSGNDDDNDEMDYDDDKSSKSSKSSKSGNTGGGGGGGGTGASNGDEQSDDDDDDDDDEEDDDDESTNNNKDDDEDDDEEDEDIDDESDDEKDSKHSNDSTSTSNSTTTTTTTTTTSTANTSSSNLNNNQVPKSMQEIYQLSNMNRRRNKEKKKLKENSSISATTSLSTSPSSLLDSTNNTPKSKKDENASVTDTFSFLKEIGWINNEQSADSFKPVSQQPASTIATTATPTTPTLSQQPPQQQQQQQPSPQLNTSTQSNKSQIQSIPQQIQQQTQSLASSSSSTTITTTTSGVVSKKQSKQTLQQPSQQQQPIQPSQQPQQQQFVSFDYSQVSTIQQTNSNNPNQQQNFFNTDFQGTKKKSSSTGSVKAKSGTFVLYVLKFLLLVCYF
ncbi:hypothetical protein ACTFIW_011214 [Dictyostelium discoideum]